MEKLAIISGGFEHFKNGLFLTLESQCATAIPEVHIVGDVIMGAGFAYQALFSS
jgi:pyruvate/2-oxoglutarate dehydrogenase complex dihydrolipoamide dehydrogenase (E3) component